LSNITNNIPASPSIDYGILQAAVTLLVGFLIFLTLGLRLSIVTFRQQTSAKPMKVQINKAGILFLIMLVIPCFTIGLALFAETIFYAKIAFILSLTAMFVFVVKRIHEVEPRGDVDF